MMFESAKSVMCDVRTVMRRIRSGSHDVGGGSEENTLNNSQDVMARVSMLHGR